MSDENYVKETEVDNTEETEDAKEDNNPSENVTDNDDDKDERPAFSTPDFDASEINRKIDAMSESIGMLTKALSQIMHNSTPSASNEDASSSTRPPSVHEGVKDFNELDL